MATSVTRRSIVSAAPAAIVAASIPAAAHIASHDDSELLALREPFDRTNADYQAALKALTPLEEAYFQRKSDVHETARGGLKEDVGLAAAEAVVERTDGANRKIVEAMCELPARTIDGLAFKAHVSLHHEDNRYEELVTSIMDDILAMAGGTHA